MNQSDKTPEEKGIAAKNMRLAIVLGLIAIAFYIAVFIKFM
jgi:hypothetical protein